MALYDFYSENKSISSVIGIKHCFSESTSDETFPASNLKSINFWTTRTELISDESLHFDLQCMQFSNSMMEERHAYNVHQSN